MCIDNNFFRQYRQTLIAIDISKEIKREKRFSKDDGDMRPIKRFLVGIKTDNEKILENV